MSTCDVTRYLYQDIRQCFSDDTRARECYDIRHARIGFDKWQKYQRQGWQFYGARGSWNIPESSRNHLMAIYKVYWQSCYLLLRNCTLLKIIVTVKLKICWIVWTHVAMNICSQVEKDDRAHRLAEYSNSSDRPGERPILLSFVPNSAAHSSSFSLPLRSMSLLLHPQYSARLHKYLHNWRNEWRTYVNKCKLAWDSYRNTMRKFLEDVNASNCEIIYFIVAIIYFRNLIQWLLKIEKSSELLLNIYRNRS